MFKIFASLALLLAVTQPVLALPGDHPDKMEKFIKNHSFFPSTGIPDNIKFGLPGSTAQKVVLDMAHEFDDCGIGVRALSDDRLLIFETCTTFNFGNPSVPLPIESEKISVLRDRICKQLIFDHTIENSNIGRTGHNKDIENCKKNIGVNFLEPRSNEIYKVIDLVYNDDQTLKNDIKGSKMFFKGQRYFYSGPDELDSTQYVRKMIPSGPIEERYYRGLKYDYRVTKFFIAYAKHGYWEYQIKTLKEDLALHNKLQEDERKQLEDQKKTRPYEL